MRREGRVYQRRGPRRADGSRVTYAGHWVAYPAAGQTRREAVGCACMPGKASCAAAADLLLRRRAAHDRAPMIASEERLTVNDALDAYVLYLRDRGAASAAKTERRMAIVRELLGSRLVLELRPAHFAAYRTARGAMTGHRTRGRVVKPGTVWIEMVALRSAIYRLRIEGRLLHVPHVPVPAKSKPRQGFVEPETFARLLPLIADAQGADPDVYREMAEFKYTSGRRYEEVAGLQWEHVFLRDAELRLPVTKNGDPLTMPLVGRMLAIIEARHAKRRLDSPYVFHRNGARVDTALRRHIEAAGRALGLSLVPHDFRRSAARNLIRSGVSRAVAKSITGHRSDRVFDYYNITSTDDQRRALAAVEAYSAERQAGSNVTTLTRVHAQ